MPRSRALSVSVLALATALLVGIRPAAAQSQGSHWVVTASYTPEWKIAPFVQDFLSEDDDTINFEGTEFTIGMGRGSTRGGDWNIAYVRKPFKDGVVSTENNGPDCFTPFNQPQICASSTETTSFKRVYLDGIEADWFLSFVRIKNRVQVGLDVGAGIGFFKGDVVKTKTGEEIKFSGNTTQKVPLNTTETTPVKDELLPFFPLFKVGVEGGVILTPALKVKVAYGLNFPGKSFRVAATYLIGAH